MNKTIKYPDITVSLIGKDGNAFNIIGIMTNELRKNSVPQKHIDEFLEDIAMSSDYNHLIRTCSRWVKII